MEKERKFDFEATKEAVKNLLIAMGEDPERPGLLETPKRVAGYWQELLEGNNYTNKEIAEKYSKSFEVGYDPIVTIYQENIYSHCEHHLALMFDGSAVIGYIPVQNEDGTFKVLGLSKLYRIVEMCSKRLQLQEKLASDIAECISLATGSKEVYVNLNMKHGCVSARGVKAQGSTNVAFMTPTLRANKDAREEFERKASEIVARNIK
ncbi:MAG: GTP cyclohydrolase I FolE [Acholeplasmatales bacterium]|nr:GTP cyclohydrolase I FolE [Acholeplasmatales bacterium]